MKNAGTGNVGNNVRGLRGWVAVMLAAGLLMGMPVRAADIHVSTNATPEAPYATWATAFTSLQDALDYAQANETVGTIRLAGHIFAAGPQGANDYVYRLAVRSDLEIIGGYEAAGDTPGDRNPDQWPTVIARTEGDVRVLNLESVSNVVIRTVTIRDGWLRGTTAIDGGGILMTDCDDVTFDNVHVVANKLNGGDNSRGSGMSLINSHLTMTDCLIADNELRYETGVLGNRSRGGGISLFNSELIMNQGMIASNLVSPNRHGWGGGVYLGGSSAMTVSNASFVANHANARGRAQGRGGAFYVDNGATLDIQGSKLTGNIAERGQSAAAAYGGAVYVNAGGTVTIAESVLAGNKSVSNTEAFGGAIYNLGTARLRNTLIKNNAADRSLAQPGSGIEVAGANSLTVIDCCTIVDNEPGVGIGIRYAGGTIAVSNSIVWGHAIDLSGFPRDPDGRLPDVWYSNVGDERHAGWQGSHAVDPFFADSIWYHLSSTAGHYTNGYFGDGDWTTAAINSPLIDRGDPDADFSREPPPNGGRLNMGAYANTEVAAKTPAAGEQAPTVDVDEATQWGRTTVRFSGAITDIGDEIPLAWFDVWPEGGGPTNSFPMGLQTNTFTRNVTGLTPDVDYRFRVRATNAGGTALSAERTFSTRSMAATDWYVTPGGDNTSGASWSAAHTCLNTMLNVLVSGDTVYLAGEIAGNPRDNGGDEVYRIEGLDDIRILGGYEGSPGLPAGDHPGPRDAGLWSTTLRPISEGARVISLVSVSNVLVESVTIRDGVLFLAGAARGGGVYMEHAQDVVFNDCHIIDNAARGHPSYGGGIYLVNSDLRLTGCTIISNLCRYTRYSAGNTFGGGIYVGGSAELTVLDSVMDANHANAFGRAHGRGGGIYVASQGAVDIRDSHIRGNLASRGQNNTSAYGGGLFIAHGGSIDIWNTTILDNEARGVGTGNGFGGGMYHQGAAWLRNVLMTGNFSQPDTRLSDGIELDHASAHLVVESSTLADNNPATAGNVAIRYVQGTIALTNTIVWGHDDDLLDLPVDGAGHFVNVSHCLFGAPETMHQVNGCIVGVDPAFAGNGDYRLKDGSGAHGGMISPAIDEGINLPWMHDATDLAGFARIRRSRRQMGLLVDIGAFEAEPPRGTFISIR